MSRNSVIALQGDNHIADAISEHALEIVGASDNSLAGFNSGLAICEYCGFSHEILTGCNFAHATIETVRSFSGIDRNEYEYIARYSDGVDYVVPNDHHNSVDMFILADGTLIDLYAPKLLPSGRAAKVSHDSAWEDWDIQRRILTSKARKIRESFAALNETIETDSQVLVSFRIVSVRGVRWVNETLKNGKGFVSASHVVASHFLDDLVGMENPLTFADLSTFRDKTKKVGAVSTSSASVAENAAGLNKAKLLEMLAKMSDQDVLALTSKLMA